MNHSVNIADIFGASRRIRPHIARVPMRFSRYLSRATGAEVWLKLENLQPTGSFKIRGALNKLLLHAAVVRRQGAVAASAGNHALGVAFAAERLQDVRATVVVPKSAPQAKVARLRGFNVELLLHGDRYEEAHQRAAALAVERGALEIPAYDDADIIAGQGSVGLEIVSDAPETDVIMVPVGGGGLIAGIAAAAAALQPRCAVVGVQPEASPAALLSLRTGKAHDPYDHAPTIADGLAGGFGALPLSLIGDQVRDIVLEDEATIRQAVFALIEHEQLLVEPSGAIAIAPLLRGGVDVAGKRVVCVLTGGNLAVGLLDEIVRSGLRGRSD